MEFWIQDRFSSYLHGGDFCITLSLALLSQRVTGYFLNDNEYQIFVDIGWTWISQPVIPSPKTQTWDGYKFWFLEKIRLHKIHKMQKSLTYWYIKNGASGDHISWNSLCVATQTFPWCNLWISPGHPCVVHLEVIALLL